MITKPERTMIHKTINTATKPGGAGWEHRTPHHPSP